MTLPTPAEAAQRLRQFTTQWTPGAASERSAFQTWWLGFLSCLGAPPPAPPTPDHQFELPVSVTNRDGGSTTNFIDYWKAGHAAVEGKATSGAGVDDRVLRSAFGQVRNYVAHVPGTPPPYLVVVDVGKVLMVWDRWSGSYGDFGAGRRIPLTTLHERPDDIRLLQDLLVQPAVRDPRGKAQAVTREIAAKLAALAAAFEDRGHDSEQVARFLMRCVFCFFAEDVGLLPSGLFKRTLEAARAAGGPDHVARVLAKLWRTMDTGGDFGAELLHRFNGHFFQSVDALPLTADDIGLLIDAAAFDWSAVEPSIFGTLLVRALDPEERHRLGAEYTPREYIERLVEPTVIEPIRERWTAVQASVVQLEETEGKSDRALKKDRGEALKQLRDFHAWMRGLRFLDPACGSGNFLYVTMAAVKRVELEVIREIERVQAREGLEQTEAILDEVHPRQFHGIEIKPWAREIAELTLWIGYHQFWRETHGGRTPPDPILEDTGTIECRDAILAWDAIVHRPEKDRPDPTPRIVHPVTGEMVPDPGAKLHYAELVAARIADWPEADFIIGNPPYLGQARQREALGDGYVDALRTTYAALPDTVDLVVYWWHRAAMLVASGRTLASGLITTKSISQGQNRACVEGAIAAGARLTWVVANHPWVDGADGAAVRVALTVLRSDANVPSRVARVDASGAVVQSEIVTRINADLSSHADIALASSRPLLANAGLAHDGVKLHGAGFIVSQSEAEQLNIEQAVLRRYLNGRDVAQRSRQLRVVDFGLMSEDEARAFPNAFDAVRARVRPQREANRRETYRKFWWRFGEPRRDLRDAVGGLRRMVITVDTARHRYFRFVATDVTVDDKLVAVASDGAWLLALLSSQLHVDWATAAGGRMGKGNDPVYVKSRCFDAFPFPVLDDTMKARLGELGERLDTHRATALSSDSKVTMTGMYNVLEKLRNGEKFTVEERTLYVVAACGILKDLHDQLDALVAEAYGWPWPMAREEILERLVALHAERVEEEKRGLIRWLRPEYQIPRFVPDAAPATLALEPAAASPDAVAPAAAASTPLPWPDTAIEQFAVLGALIARRSVSVDEAVAAFAQADRKLIARHLETLQLIGEAVLVGEGRYARAQRAA